MICAGEPHSYPWFSRGLRPQGRSTCLQPHRKAAQRFYESPTALETPLPQPRRSLICSQRQWGDGAALYCMPADFYLNRESHLLVVWMCEIANQKFQWKERLDFNIYYVESSILGHISAMPLWMPRSARTPIVYMLSAIGPDHYFTGSRWLSMVMVSKLILLSADLKRRRRRLLRKSRNELREFTTATCSQATICKYILARASSECILKMESPVLKVLLEKMTHQSQKSELLLARRRSRAGEQITQSQTRVSSW